MTALCPAPGLGRETQAEIVLLLSLFHCTGHSETPELALLSLTSWFSGFYHHIRSVLCEFPPFFNNKTEKNFSCLWLCSMSTMAQLAGAVLHEGRVRQS